MKQNLTANLRDQPEKVPTYVYVEASISRFGVDPRLLKPASERLVVTDCEACGVERIKKFRCAITQRLCANCSNTKNSRLEAGRGKRQEFMRRFYANGGKTPTAGVGHSKDARLKISASRLGVKPNLTPLQQVRMAERCLVTLNNDETKAKTAALNSARRGKLSQNYGRKPAHTKKTWYSRSDGTRVCFRSSWEAAFASWLDANGKTWSYEPTTFPVSYVVNGAVVDGTYTPDFLVGNTWYEVKGLWTVEGRAKFDAFKIRYNSELIEVIDRAWLKTRNLLPKRKVT